MFLKLFMSPWLELKLQPHFVIFSAHRCANIGFPDYAAHVQNHSSIVVRTRFSYKDPPPLPVLQDPAVKLTNQGQAKLRHIGDHRHPNILFLQS